MKLIGLMPVRNEAHELGLTLRAALQWCDEVVVRIHGSTDASMEIARAVRSETGERVWVYEHPETEWNEMDHRQKLLNFARLRQATHIAIIDADEILTGNLLVQHAKPFGSILGMLDKTVPGTILQLPLYNLRGSLDRYHANGIWGNRWLSVAFADDPRLGWSGDKFHSREPQGIELRPYRPIQQGEGGVLHLWGASERRLTAKHALYKATERLRYPDKPVQDIERMYNLWRSPEDSKAMWPDHLEFQKPWTYTDTPKDWWTAYDMLIYRHLDLRANPWQEAEVRRLVAEHGAETFKGLDLFGC